MCIRDSTEIAYIVGTGSCGGSNSNRYLDVTVTKHDISVAEIKNRIAQGKQVTRELHSTLWSNQLRPETKIKMYKIIVESIVTYGAEV